MSPKRKAGKKSAKTSRKKKPATWAPRKFRALKGRTKAYWNVPLQTAQIFFPYAPVVIDSAVAVMFDDNGSVNQPEASRSRGDCVWFLNLSNTDRSITLDHWPFKPIQPPPHGISVPAQTAVGPFILDSRGYNGTITCAGDPPFDPGGPGDPQFDAGN